MKTGVVLADVAGGLIGTIIPRQLHRTGLEIQPDARLDEFPARPVIVRIESELEQLDIGLHKPGVLEFAQLPGVPEPGGDVGFGLGFEFRIFEASAEILAALLAKRVQAVQLIECRAVNAFPL